MIKDFKKFILRGNVLDLAVAVIMGGAFGKIVTSLVDDIIMPLVGVFLGGVDFTGLSYNVGDSVVLYGQFIQSVIDFLIIAFFIFLFVRILSKMKKEEPEEETSPVPTNEELLLEDIRDLLKEKQL